MGNGGAGAAAAAAAAIANAVKASGILVRVSPEDFRSILQRARSALVVTASGGLFSTKYRYLVSYKGLAFYTVAREAISLPADAEVVSAKSIWIPG